MIESISQSSNIGSPPIFNYTNENYRASPQNWDIAQDHRGILYFGNNEGLLEFDGTFWKTYPISNQTLVRSVEIAPNGRIYVGAQGELGYFEENEEGELVYCSLVAKMPNADQNFADVWDIEIFEEAVLFRTGNKIFRFDQGKIETIYQAASIGHMAKVDENLFIHDTQKGLLKLEEGQFKPIEASSIFINQEVSSILPFGKDDLFISTINHGLYLYSENEIRTWSLNDNDLIRKSGVYCAAKIDENKFALGTSRNGLFIVEKSGRVSHHLNRSEGLQINNVLSLFTDSSRDLWIALDNGIDYIQTSSAYTYVYPDPALKVTGYAVKIHDDKLYFGTSGGAYVNDWLAYYNPLNNSRFQKVKNSDGQVWDLSIHFDELFLNHHEGTFLVKGNEAKKISDKKGAWIQLPIGENQLLAGNYEGLSLLEKNPTWKLEKDFHSEWVESCRIMVQDKNQNIWVSHPYRGVFKVHFDKEFSKLEEVKLYNEKNGFPSNLQIYVFKIGDEAVFCAERGIYTYNNKSDRFELDEKWNTIFDSNTRVNHLKEDADGNIWYSTPDEVGVLRVSDAGIYKKINQQVLPQLKGQLVGAFEEILPHDDENVLVATGSGFIHFNPSLSKPDSNFTVLIRSVRSIHNDSMIYRGNSLREDVEIKYKNNALRFEYSSNHYGNRSHNLYQHYLENGEEAWSNWTQETQVDYTNLSGGNYTFHVRTKNVEGIISPTNSFSFRIKPAWFASTLAYFIYTLLLAAGIFFLLFIPRKKFERERAALEIEQQKTIEEKEQQRVSIEEKAKQQIDQLEKEKLELQIKAKNQELASSTMHLVQKNEMLQSIKEDIQKIANKTENEKVQKDLKKVVRKISADERLDTDWETFAKHFDQVHNQFLQRLSFTHPKLSPKDHRLCAYLRMNMTSKEIAPLLNISVRSVEVARYRLRKKLNISAEKNLVEFMLEF